MNKELDFRGTIMQIEVSR